MLSVNFSFGHIYMPELTKLFMLTSCWTLPNKVANESIGPQKAVTETQNKTKQKTARIVR